MPNMVVGTPSVNAHSCVDVADLASRLEVILEVMGDPGPDPGDGSGVPAEPPYVVYICLTTNFEGGKAIGVVSNRDGTPVPGLEEVEVPDPTGGSLEGQGAGSCFDYIATIDPSGGKPEIVIVSGSGGGATTGIGEFQITANMTYAQTAVTAQPVGATRQPLGPEVILLDPDGKWFGLMAYTSVAGDTHGYRFQARFVTTDYAGMGKEAWEIISGDHPAPTLFVRRRSQDYSKTDGQYQVLLDEGLGAANPAPRLPEKAQGNYDILCDDPQDVAGSVEWFTTLTATWSSARSKYVITSAAPARVKPSELAMVLPGDKVEAYDDVDGVARDMDFGNLTGTVLLLDFDRDGNDEVIFPVQKMVAKQIPDPNANQQQSNPPPVDAVYTAINHTGTNIEAAPGEPVIVGGYVETLTDGNGNSQSFFMITSFPELRGMPGYKVGVAPTGEDDPDLQIPYHSGGSKGFQLDSEECDAEDPNAGP